MDIVFDKLLISKEELQVGLFFFINGIFEFSGCSLKDAEEYGDFLIYPKSHYDIWEKSFVENWTVDYDYFPRGRVVYRKSDDLFIIYYDKCIRDDLERLTREYEGVNYKTELDEHYCCHKCNKDYLM